MSPRNSTSYELRTQVGDRCRFVCLVLYRGKRIVVCLVSSDAMFEQLQVHHFLCFFLFWDTHDDARGMRECWAGASVPPFVDGPLRFSVGYDLFGKMNSRLWLFGHDEGDVAVSSCMRLVRLNGIGNGERLVVLRDTRFVRWHGVLVGQTSVGKEEFNPQLFVAPIPMSVV